MDITYDFYCKLKAEDGVMIHFAPDHILAADIIEVKEHANLYGIGRTPFSVLFFVRHDLVFPQQIYTILTKDKQTFEVFLVPVGPADGGIRYEAVYG